MKWLIGVVRRSLLTLHGLGLDAPLVAVSWQNLAAVEWSVELTWLERLALFLATWLVYLGDRLLDARRSQQLTLFRHHFVSLHLRKLTPLWGLLFAVAIPVGWLAVVQRAFFSAGFFGVLVLFYFAICYGFPYNSRKYLPREIIVSTVFVVAVLFFPFVQASRLQMQFMDKGGLLPFLMFLLAWVNCASISIWEADDDQAAGQTTIATRWPSLKNHYCWLAINCAIILLLTALVWPQERFLLLAGAGVVALLCCIDWLGKIWEPLRSFQPLLADLSLMFFGCSTVIIG